MSKELTIEKYVSDCKSLDDLGKRIMINTIKDYIEKSDIVKKNYFRGYDDALKDARQENLFAK